MVCGRGSLVVKVSDRGWLVTSSSPVPLKTRPVAERYTLELSRAGTSCRWCSVVVRRGGCQLSWLDNPVFRESPEVVSALNEQV
ncbi:hypothetical protein TNCV_3918981 [Trichonephila clavipes]|nr:hypothetical protein TNCV_3918981 [Trichonephila clavipes]